jgi:mannitol-specific phosphotransferase system IIBC component
MPDVASVGSKGLSSGVVAGASVASGLIVNFAFASLMKKDQKKFEEEIAKLDSKKQAELLAKVQQAETELERQKIVFQYIDKQKIDKLIAEGKKDRLFLYLGLGVGLLAYVLIILKLKKR